MGCKCVGCRTSFGLAVDRLFNRDVDLLPLPSDMVSRPASLHHRILLLLIFLRCRELWRQARSRKVRKEFSKYTVGLEVNQNGLPAVVKVVYVDGSKLDIPAQGKDAGELMLDVLGGTEGMKDKEDAAEMEKN